MHDEVGVRNALVNLPDTVDTQDVAGRLLGELVGTVGSSDRDGKGIDIGGLDELGGFLDVGQEHVHIELALGAMAVFLAHLTGFK